MAYYCTNCRKSLPGDDLKKIAIGETRNVVFCAECNCYVSIEETKSADAK